MPVNAQVLYPLTAWTSICIKNDIVLLYYNTIIYNVKQQCHIYNTEIYKKATLDLICLIFKKSTTKAQVNTKP